MSQSEERKTVVNVVGEIREQNARRKLVKSSLWIAPSVIAISLPVHAQSSATPIPTSAPCPSDPALPPDSSTGEWKVSDDAGSTYYFFTGPIQEVDGPKGTQRFRILFDFECAGIITFTVSGDKYDGQPPPGGSEGGSIYVDGLEVVNDTGQSFADRSFVLTISSSGIHTIEWYHGRAVTTGSANITDPLFRWSDYDCVCT